MPMKQNELDTPYKVAIGVAEQSSRSFRWLFLVLLGVYEVRWRLNDSPLITEPCRANWTTTHGNALVV
jgi:hypothetical protein